MGKLFIVINEPDTTAAFFGEWIAQEGVELLECHAYRGDPIPNTLDGLADGLLVLGGSMNCQDDDIAPWLPAVRALLRREATSFRPTLGICLGGQLLSVALGGKVERSTHGEQVGTYDLAPVCDLSDDLIFSSISGPVRAAQWHVDEITELPAGAELLISDDEFPHQAYRVGERTWGVQFHPEIGGELMAEWSTPSSMKGLSRTPAEVIAETEAAEGQLRATWQPVARSFARLLT
ncbi:unannotated protein [freshwater metagenome]|jgi:GMP synthase-like glutamine amidotransferase|uniref:Unannotated protein n=1 Tax=freshwater metagenome TaxID=449393 RepID=A0A6J7BGY6_9ZZZZ|nr:type 1 glutamine amidotransferase [Actinomycetota bacterium]MSY52344.1 type 1 glutamine amidotransferase [Actinomycetota bacterium]MSY87609.1 type 1 glutamine amidotransferase [Actinomycetota bacterium]MTA50229.1 type 1 glutamine amidotransferase [Actinomycetota bacterium]